MQALDQTQLNTDIIAIQILHSYLGNDLAKCLAYHTGGFMFIKELVKRNITVSRHLYILQNYSVIGDTEVTEHYNVLTVQDIQDIIDDCYRELEKYNT